MRPLHPIYIYTQTHSCISMFSPLADNVPRPTGITGPVDEVISPNVSSGKLYMYVHIIICIYNRYIRATINSNISSELFSFFIIRHRRGINYGKYRSCT